MSRTRNGMAWQRDVTHHTRNQEMDSEKLNAHGPLSKGVELTQDDFCLVHSLCQLDNVGVWSGAGASVGCGGKTMKDVWKSFKQNYPSFWQHLLINIFWFGIHSDNNLVNVELLIDEATKFLL
ncbi:hypothetical protein ACTMQE_08270 [Escherichia coli]